MGGSRRRIEGLRRRGLCEMHFALRINPRTLRRDDTNGTIIHPKHVHKALRRYMAATSAS